MHRNAFFLLDLLQDWWGFLMDQREKQHLFYFHAILMYAGVRGGCIHPESDLLASYAACIAIAVCHGSVTLFKVPAVIYV